MKQEMDGTVEALEKLVYGEKTYEDLVAEAAAMERLSNAPDFKIYRKLLLEAYAALVRRIRLASREDLVTLQGAIIQHEILVGLPEKVIKTAERLIAEKRGGIEI